MNWIRKWEVPSTNNIFSYTVSQSDTGEWGCSCPAWKYHRINCKHIRKIQTLNEHEYATPLLVRLGSKGVFTWAALASQQSKATRRK